MKENGIRSISGHYIWPTADVVKFTRADGIGKATLFINISRVTTTIIIICSLLKHGISDGGPATT